MRVRTPKVGNRKETLAAMLAEQGFGSRKECGRLVWAGLVEIGYQDGADLVWRKAELPNEALNPEGLFLRVDGLTLPYFKKMYIAMHKPVDTECSHAPSHYPSIFSLLPEPFLNRGIEAVGRLDADTTGLILLTDSGPFNHFFTSPKRHVPKTYRVGAKHPITPEQKTKLEAGVTLRSETVPTLPAKIKLIGDKECEMTLEEGKYHQVKRMFGAVGNRVESIHRVAIGNFRLETTLESGGWRFLEADDLTALGFKGI